MAFYLAALDHIGRVANTAQPTTCVALAPQIYEKLGDMLALTGQYEEARTAFQQALQTMPDHDPIAQARVQHKIGKVWETERNYDAALGALDRAETMLGGEPREPALQWWQAWVDIQIERMSVHYWRAEADAISKLSEQTWPIVVQYGTPVQRANFLLQLVNMKVRRERYMVSKVTLAYCEGALAASEESGDLNTITSAR